MSATKRVAWTAEEDEKLLKLTQMYGENWVYISKQLNGRIGKQCRERWKNHLQPGLKRDHFTQEEDRKILELVDEHGTCWSKFLGDLPGRSENQIKNRYYCSLRPKEAKQIFMTSRLKSPSLLQSVSSSVENLLPANINMGENLMQSWMKGSSLQDDFMEDINNGNIFSNTGNTEDHFMGAFSVDGMNTEQRGQCYNLIDQITLTLPEKYCPQAVDPSNRRIEALQSTIYYLQNCQTFIQNQVEKQKSESKPTISSRPISQLPTTTMATHEHVLDLINNSANTENSQNGNWFLDALKLIELNNDVGSTLSEKGLEKKSVSTVIAMLVTNPKIAECDQKQDNSLSQNNDEIDKNINETKKKNTNSYNNHDNKNNNNNENNNGNSNNNNNNNSLFVEKHENNPIATHSFFNEEHAITFEDINYLDRNEQFANNFFGQSTAPPLLTE